ncbi:MAG: hypothetical protein KFW07_03155 [Mycoplasmataceae bacterium]|nr:hypothetical protein [Mycoplasmataceae bacterium]
MNKFLEILGKMFKSVGNIINKSKCYDKAEGIIVFEMKNKLTEYKINKDRSILEELLWFVNFVEMTGFNGRTTELVAEVKQEHELQLILKPSSSIKDK